ncbi:MAG TPA: hypothetical protein VF638_13120 [Sphingomonas sp.]
MIVVVDTGGVVWIGIEPWGVTGADVTGPDEAGDAGTAGGIGRVGGVGTLSKDDIGPV